MNFHLHHQARRPLACCLPLLLATAPVRAQGDTEAIAAAIVRSLAPASDDPDAIAHDLVTTALQHPRGPAAPFLLEEALRRLSALQQPATLRALVRGAPREARSGLLALRLQELGWYLDRAVDGPCAPGRGADDQPFPDHASTVLVAGPFGDHGDHFTGVPFGPELQFPALGTEWPGRGTRARVRAVERKPDRRRIDLGDPALDQPGCYYALQRVAVQGPLTVYLEVECEGAFQVFTDGTEVLRVEPWMEPGPARRYVPLQLPAGQHELVVKTCSLEHRTVALRWVSVDGATEPGVKTLPFDTPREPATTAATLATEVPFVTALDVFARAAAAATAPALVRIAALRVAVQSGSTTLALQLAEQLQATPPTDPTELLALGSLLPNVDLPDELRTAAARTFEERAIGMLPREHHQARIAEARLLEQQDRREDALRLLAALPAAGPATWSYRHALAQRLHFDAEHTPLLHDWVAACPRDPRPLLTLADQARTGGDPRGALALLLRAHALRPDQTGALQRAFALALDLGDTQAASGWLEVLAPLAPNAPPSLERRQLELRISTSAGDTARSLELLRAIVALADADAATLRRCAGRATALGDAATTRLALERCLALDADQPPVRAWLAELGALPLPGADFATFRRSADEARMAFQPGDRESGATSTLVLDQRIVEFQPDGSWLAEVHELRRINDLAGVEEFRSASAPAGADEVLLLRTIGTDGRSYVPPKIEEAYALQRLEPGAFVEMRYRERGAAPGPDPLRTERFYFQSGDAASLLGELVVIQPASGRGELRRHALGEPTRQTTLTDGRRVQVYTREHTPRLPQERWSPGLGELVPFAEFGEDEVPYAMLREARVQMLRRTRATPAVRGVAATLFAGSTDERARAAAAWDFCQQQIEDGPAESAAHAILRRKGNRFLVAVALLREAGIRVVPTIYRDERPELGAGADTLFQTADTHQVPGAMVMLGSGEVLHLFVDSPRHWPLGAIPATRAGTTGFVVADAGLQVVTLPPATTAGQGLRVRGTAAVAGDDLTLTAELVIGDAQGFALAERIRELTEDVRKLAARQIAQQMLPGWRVQSAAVDTDAPGQPFRLQCKARRTAAQKNGTQALLPLPLAPGKFLANFGDRAERHLPARLTVDMANEWDITLDLGPDLALAELPAPHLVLHDGLLYQLTTTRVGGTLHIQRTVRITPTTMAPERFGDWLRALAAADRADQQSLQLVARAQ